MKKLALVLGAGIVLGLLALFIAWRTVVGIVEAPSSLSAPLSLTVPNGATLRSVLRQLEEAKAIERTDWIYLWARLENRTNVRAGEYDLEPKDSPRRMLDKIIAGQVRTAKLTLVPGHNRWQVRSELADAGWMDGKTFDRLCDDKDLLAAHGLSGPSCEGFLFAETYVFARGIAPREIFATAYATTRKVLDEVKKKGRGPLDFDDLQLLTLASIVEKETGAIEERPRIACLFYNRLRAKPPWRLDTDPTVIYAATLADPNFNGNLKRWHLHEMDHPYNTYRVAGLPPGPIASMSREALAAVVEPASCGDFFFVSRNDGTHEFCPTLDCHNAAVQKWQVEYFRRKK